MPAYPPFQQSPVFNTQLNPLDEMAFRQWVQNNRVPFNPNQTGPSDYDMRGYYQGMVNQNPMAAPTQVNPNDQQLHYTDYYKTPLHQSFSSESQWATPQTPSWINDSQLASPGGRILFDEKANQAAQADPQTALIKALMGQ
jgi:hypothetical protein